MRLKTHKKIENTAIEVSDFRPATGSPCCAAGLSIEPASRALSVSLEWASVPVKSAKTNCALVVLRCKSRSE